MCQRSFLRESWSWSSSFSFPKIITPKTSKNTVFCFHFAEAINFVIVYKILFIQLEKDHKSITRIVVFRELFCNNFGQDGA